MEEDLQISFPEKSKKEIRKFEKAIYRNMAVVVCEILKSLSMTEKDFKNRVSFKNMEYLRGLREEKKSCMIYLAHYGNWEWLVSLTPEIGEEAVTVYKRIHNKLIEDFVLYKRTSFGATMIDQKMFPRHLAGLVRKKALEERSHFFLMIADQRPREHQESVQVDFLGRKTHFLLGPEKVARHLDIEMIYLKMRRVKLGFYEISFIPFGNPSDKPVGLLTKRLVRQLESDIEEDPSPWFWLHNRWKKDKK